MSLPVLVSLFIALAIGSAAAWWSWRDRLDAWPERTAAIARALAVAALVLLLLDPGIAGRVLGRRALVLLDNSVSMHAAGGHASDAAATAATLGDTTSFGELAPGEPGAHATLADALTGALAGGRPVVVVTDGEIGDTAAIPATTREAISVRLTPRTRGPDIAFLELRAPARLSAGDTLAIEVEALRTADAPDSASVEVRAGKSVLLHGVIRFAGGVRGRTRLVGALPAGLSGAQWLEVARTGAADAEPGDDVRWWLLTITPTPGVVVLATTPDWDARFLYRTLREVVEVPVRGYVQLEPGAWRRMDDLRRVAATEVTAAAKNADLLAVRGVATPWQTSARARLLWAPGETPGDWYLGPAGASPVAGAFVGAPIDSLAPASAVTALESPGGAGWIGATARLARRGSEVPVLVGREGPGGRSVLVGADGLYRWAFRGGVSEQLWRGLIAGAASWLLASPGADGARAVPVASVTERGRPVRFRWSGSTAATPLAVRLDADGTTRRDTLRFDGSGEATLALPVGRYRYSLDGGGTGVFGVEPFSVELLPAAITLPAHTASVAPAALPHSLREAWWLFALATLGLVTEWLLRRRFGLR
ncbi:MAG: hypothetical protein ABIZ70_09765 [Gemmatimonadales bacterium]